MDEKGTLDSSIVFSKMSFLSTKNPHKGDSTTKKYLRSLDKSNGDYNDSNSICLQFIKNPNMNSVKHGRPRPGISNTLNRRNKSLNKPIQDFQTLAAVLENPEAHNFGRKTGSKSMAKHFDRSKISIFNPSRNPRPKYTTTLTTDEK
ncbi:unnamed protein product [Moneuplotes crassus]|uniref:Uncharacterized protein n=1 Tax=Euplotes crassus TaxID=5936 RepID=A0AAD1Y1D6_EUPCR|nr:unnamed protein product [Moneuplotes crassus]